MTTIQEKKTATPKSYRRFLRWPGLKFWAIGIVLASGGIGFTATSMLLGLPEDPNCVTVYWPLASASMRLYCAQASADKQTVDDLLKAIALVKDLPDDHPLRNSIDQKIEQWAQNILTLAEDEFHQGELEAAIETARRVPQHVSAYTLVEDQISDWESTWAKGEEIYQEAENFLKQSEWSLAFRAAVKLTRVDNKYWSSNRYDSLVNKIQLAREESRKLDEAYAALEKGGLENLLDAIKQAELIEPESYVHHEAQKLIEKASNKLLALAKKALEQKDWNRLAEVASRIPNSLDLQKQVSDLNTLASAGLNADLGTINGLESAISEAKKLDPSRPLYYDAQNLVTRWQLEIEDIAHLEKARILAQAGSVGDLNAAVAEARLIAYKNPRYDEAQKEIQQWVRQIQLAEDRPFLNRAVALARNGNVEGWRQAIEQASLIRPKRPLYDDAQNNIRQWRRNLQLTEDRPILNRARELARSNTVEGWRRAIQQAKGIGPNRTLYDEAQNNIRQWSSSIQRSEDRPILNRATSLGNRGDYQAAIQTAQQIASGRNLYNEAQAKIRGWQQEVNAAQTLEKAYEVVNAGTPDAFAAAIRMAQGIPNTTQVANQKGQAINSWSYQLLSLAQNRAGFSLVEAIAIAKLIPAQTPAYTSAQTQIQNWQQALQPPAPAVPVPPNVEIEAPSPEPIEAPNSEIREPENLEEQETLNPDSNEE